ncbi:hypothetical protein NECAME_02977 [Necator americanus]|uniref:Mos1 transposase HTH domain-containing protein n=1 Tax=Necator americanus TaxID=51031 RepID=W2T806_NECAM|nr:hypothetical protein NECAME_02977 [Necator americanus]ETN78018.1 hypothetical protein NECAME_02977 [Necator americanus]
MRVYEQEIKGSLGIFCEFCNLCIVQTRHVLLYEFESGHPIAEAHRNLSQVFGTEAPSERSLRAWLKRFKAGNKKLEEELRSGRKTAVSFDELKNLAEQHLYGGVRYFAANPGCSKSTRTYGDESYDRRVLGGTD